MACYCLKNYKSQWPKTVHKESLNWVFKQISKKNSLLYPDSILEGLYLVLDVPLGSVPLALLQLQPVGQRQLVRLERQRQGDELAL